jgi:GNAT superfamily N-acetyltransferase
MGRRKQKRPQRAAGTPRDKPDPSVLSVLGDPRRALAAPLASGFLAPEPLSRRYGFVRSRQLEGTIPGDPQSGVWPITALRIGYGWGSVRASDWPDAESSERWPPSEPEGLDRVAKRLRGGYYLRIRTLEDCKQAIATGQLPFVSVRITEDWFHAERGVIPGPSPDDKIIGCHAISLLGYDNESRTIRFANSSWGHEWGDGGLGTLSYDYYENRSIESWIHAIGSPTWALANKAARSSEPHESGAPDFRELEWGVRDILRGGTLHACEVYDLENDERIGWSFAVERDGFLDVEELFVRPAYRRRGQASKLSQMLLKRSALLGLTLRLWVSYADCGPENRAALEGSLASLSLHLSNSPYRWAAYVGFGGPRPHGPLEPIVVPDRPAMNRAAWRAGAILASSLAVGSAGDPATGGYPNDSSRAVEHAPASGSADSGSEQMPTEGYGIPGIEYDLISAVSPHASAELTGVVSPPAGDCDLANAAPASPDKGADAVSDIDPPALLARQTDDSHQIPTKVSVHPPNLKALAILDAMHERQRSRPCSSSAMTQNHLSEARSAGMYGYGDGFDE